MLCSVNGVSCITHTFQILNLPFILAIFKCPYLPRWTKVEWVWGAKLLSRPQSNPPFILKGEIWLTSEIYPDCVWREFQNLFQDKTCKSWERWNEYQFEFSGYLHGPIPAKHNLGISQKLARSHLSKWREGCCEFCKVIWHLKLTPIQSTLEDMSI